MNYAPTYPAPTIMTQQAGTYYDDEASSSSSAGAHDRKHKIRYDNRHGPMSTMPTTMSRSPQILQQQQQLGHRSRSRNRRSSEPHRHHYDSRSRSSDRSPFRLPRGYRPSSPDRYSHNESRSRGFSHSLSPPQNIPMGNRSPGGYSDPRTQPSTGAGNLYNTIPPFLPKHGHHSNRHRSSSHSRSNGYSSSRPQYFHRRSRSYDGAPLQSPRNAYPLPQQGYVGYSPVSPPQPFQTQGTAYSASGYPAMSMGYGVGAVQPSSASPVVMHPQAHQTTVMPLNNGKDGWVVVPAQGQSVSVAVSSFVLSSFRVDTDSLLCGLYSNTDPVPTTQGLLDTHIATVTLHLRDRFFLGFSTSERAPKKASSSFHSNRQWRSPFSI